MLRQTARNLYNWKAATLSPLVQNDIPREEPYNDSGEYHDNGSDGNGDDEWWTTHWEEQVQESEAATTATTSTSNVTITTTVIQKSPQSEKLQDIVMIVTISILVFMCLFWGLYLYCSRRRMRLQQERQAAEEEHRSQQEQTARQEKIKTNLKLVEFSEANNNNNNTSMSVAVTVPCGHSDSESDTCSMSESSHDGELGEVSDIADSQAKCANETDIEQPVAPKEEPENNTEEDVDTSALDPENSNDDDDEHCCYICLTPFEEGELVGASNNKECKHMYHKECIEEWLMKQDGCPVCRRNYLDESDLKSKDDEEKEYAL